MATPKELEDKIKRLDWAGLRSLWAAVQGGNPPGWEGGEQGKRIPNRLNSALIRGDFPRTVDSRARWSI